MRRLLIALPLLYLPACTELEPPTAAPPQTLPTTDPETERQQAAAIEAVLRQNLQADARAKVALDAKRPQLEVQAQYIADAKAIDTRPCPADFREAFARYIAAWEELHRYQKTEEAATFVDGMRIGLLNGLVNKELDGGYSRITAGHRERARAVEAALSEVEVVSNKYAVR